MTRVIWDKLVDMSDDTPDMIPRAEAEAMVEAALREAAQAIQGDEMLSPVGAHRVSARILTFITPAAQAALDRVKRKAYVDGSNAGWTTGQKAERERCAFIVETEGMNYAGLREGSILERVAAAIHKGGE